MPTPKPFDTCIILHGCPPTEAMMDSPAERWTNWLADSLNQRGLNAVAPEMPTPWEPHYDQWKAVIDEYPVTEHSVLVGHSFGAAFLARWLLESSKQVYKLILVAPAKLLESEVDTRRELSDWELPEDASYIAKKITLFASNDYPHHLKSFELYKKSLKPEVVELKNKGHFLLSTMGTVEFPELLEAVLA